MQDGRVYMSSNTVCHGTTCHTSTSWPPPWLATIREVAVAIPAPPPPDDPPELAAWDEITVEEAGEPCPKCGSLEKWWDFDNKQHCQQCEPIHRALALADLAARIRSRQGSKANKETTSQP